MKPAGDPKTNSSGATRGRSAQEPNEAELDRLWRGVRASTLAFTLLFVSGMLWRALDLPSLGGLALIGVASLGIALASIRVVLVLAYRPWAVPLLVAGGVLVLTSQCIQTAGYFSHFEQWPV